jgi:glycosyltransferase involved in cell wall biosynthesis
MHRAITPLSDLVSLARLYRYLRRERFAIVHTHTPKANLLGQLAAWLARVPIRVVTIHGFYFHDYMPRWRRRFYIWLERTSQGFAHWCFSQSREDMVTAARERICPQSKMHFLGNGVDLTLFRSEAHTESAARLRAELGFAPGAPVIGIVGRLTFEKGYREFIQAAAIIHRRHPEVFFVAIGPEDVIRCGDLYRLEGMEEINACFRWLGMRLDMPRCYAIMTAFTLPSYREGMPRVVMEAAAMSLPVVATDIRGCRETVEPYETGLLVPRRDAHALARAVLELLDDPARAQAMGEKARRKAEREFDERFVFQHVEDAYARLGNSR